MTRVATIEDLDAVVHGSESGCSARCRSRGGCPHQSSPISLTCVEASIARRADYALSKTPTDRVLSRAAVLCETDNEVVASPSVGHRVAAGTSSERSTRGATPREAIAHVTSAGYLRRCRHDGPCTSARRGFPPNEKVVDTQPLHVELRVLAADRDSLQSIAQRSGASAFTVHKIAHGACSTDRASTAEKPRWKVEACRSRAR